jgi:hypothetical protein
MASFPPDFVRRSNPDGTTNSICSKCIATVATATWEAELDSAEQCHKCDPSRLEYLKKALERVDVVGKFTE